ncbi:hypothetical protein ABEB36_004920 [Hypothenemus hampei]|uniref:THAP-type domain-containing protein n=1 Tax=Hypothenemus hampei TaxID=57062 RepID=A0ABD1EWD6_HYPHA
MSLKCIICGKSEHEVKKLFCFPKTKIGKLNLWQVNLGMVYRGTFSASVRICDEHFSNESFMSEQPLKLRPNALPIRKEIQQDVVQDVPPIIAAPKQDVSHQDMLSIVAPQVESDIQPVDLPIVLPSTSKVPVISAKSLSQRTRKSIFKKLNFSLGNETPREKALKSMVRSKEGRIRKLRRTLKRHKSVLKELATGNLIFEEVNPFTKACRIRPFIS